MPLETRPRIRTPYAPALQLPPPFRPVMLREGADAFAHAQAIAAAEGAGTLVWVGRFDLVELALILEPDEPLASARRTLYAGVAALGDALLAHAPPEKLIAYDWPAAILVDGGLVGGAQLAWPDGAAETEPPEWLVLGAMLRTTTLAHEPGFHPQATALEQEGFDLEALETGRLIESFARHFMTRLDAWETDGFAEVARAYLEHLPAEPDVERTIDGAGDLLLRRKGKAKVERRRLLPLLQQPPAWFDPQTRSPRL